MADASDHPRPISAQAPGARHILKAFRLLGSASVVTVLMSLASNKFISQALGPVGTGLMSSYRSLGMVVRGALTLGFETIIVQRLSRVKSDEERERFLGAFYLLLLLQFGAALIAAQVLPPLCAAIDFPKGIRGLGAFDVSLVAVMAFFSGATQMVSAALSGVGALRGVSVVTMAGSVATFALIQPLISLGSLGLAINVGSGNVASVGIGLYLLARYSGSAPRRMFRRDTWKQLGEMVQGTGPMLVHPLLMQPFIPAMFALVGAYFGTQILGLFGAAILLIDTSVMVLTSSIKAHILPSLGSIEGDDARRSLLAKAAAILTALALAGSVGIIVIGRPVLALANRSDYIAGYPIFAALSLSLAAQVSVWCSLHYLVHLERFRAVLCLDYLWGLSLLAFVSLAGTLHAPLEWLGFSVAASYIFSALCYWVYLWVALRERRLVARLAPPLLVALGGSGGLLLIERGLGTRALWVATACGGVALALAAPAAIRRLRG